MTPRAPIRLTSNAVVSRPAREVAAFVLDWGNDPRWRSQVTRFTVEPPGQATPGQRLVEELTFAGLRFRTPTVVESAGPLEAAYSGGSRAVRVSGWRRVTPIGPETCRIDLHTEIELTGVLRVLAPLLARPYRRTDAADVSRLAALVEGDVLRSTT
jgi:Polyketide cyclase / dehydrase and lipid transport